MGASAGLMDPGRGWGPPMQSGDWVWGEFRSVLPPGSLSRIPSVFSACPHLAATSLEQWAWLEQVQAGPGFKSDFHR